VKVSVKSSDVIDLRTNITYRAVPIGNPRKVSGNKYEVTLKLQGDRYPLTKGQVKGSIQVTITATASAEGAESKPRQVTKTISVSN
jgi:hypothetical protein